MALDRREFLTSLAALGMTACSREPEPPFPELEAGGAAGDLGFAHGATFAAKIQANLAFYTRWLGESGQVSTARLRELARSFIPVLGEHFPLMLEEMDGVARGAQLALDEIMLINARTDIMAIITAAHQALAQPACTSLALFGRPRNRPALALAQNWDWSPAMADAPVILRLHPTDGPDFVSLVEAGMLGKIGYNRERLGVCLNFLSHTSDGAPETLGVPIHCLLRVCLNCSTLDEVAATVSSVPRSASANFLLAQHGPDGPRALDLELSPAAVARLGGDARDLVHTNHFLDPTLAAGCTSGHGPSTMRRQARAEQLAAELASSVPDPVRRAERILESRADLPYPISRFHNPDPDSSTLAGIVMDLSRNRFIIARGAPHMSQWVERPGV